MCRSLHATGRPVGGDARGGGAAAVVGWLGFNVMQFRPGMDSRRGPLRYTAAAIGVGLIDPMPATAVLLYIEAVGHRHLPIAAIDYTRSVHAGATLQDIEVAQGPKLLLLHKYHLQKVSRAAPADRSATVSPALGGTRPRRT